MSTASMSARTNWAVRLEVLNTERASDGDEGSEPDLEAVGLANGPLLVIPWCKSPVRKVGEILLPPSVARHTVRPIKVERRATLLKSIACGREWLDQIVLGVAQGHEQIAADHKCNVRHVNMTVSLVFIAPALVKAAIEGRLPRGIGVATLRDAPAEWPRQFELGLAQVD